MEINRPIYRHLCLKLRIALVSLVINFPKSLWPLQTDSKRDLCLEGSGRQIISRGNSICRKLNQ